MDLDPASMPASDRYKLLIGAIVPRPIALVSTLCPDGTPNLAPFSFFAGVSSEPMSLLFCPANKRDGSMKDSLRNALPADHPDLDPDAKSAPSQGQFVVNIVSCSFANQMAACAEELPFNQSEYDLSRLTRIPSRKVLPPRVQQSLVSFECNTMSITRLAPGIAAGGNIVLGRIVHVHIADEVINERLHVDARALDAIGRMGGIAYCTTRDRFELPPSREALAVPPPRPLAPR